MLEQNVVVTDLEVYHADPLAVPQLSTVAPSVIQLIIVLVHLLVEGHNVLADPVWLSRLHPRYLQQRSYAPGLLVWQDWINNPLTYQFIKADVQPCLPLWAEAHRTRLDANLVPELQVVVTAWVLHSTDVGLLGHQVGLTG